MDACEGKHDWAGRQMMATSPEVHELLDGVAFWSSRPPWPADFHNSDYER